MYVCLFVQCTVYKHSDDFRKESSEIEFRIVDKNTFAPWFLFSVSGVGSFLPALCREP